jgi:Tfp pilus assembly protein PilX
MRLRDERGTVLPIALILMTLALGMGVAVLNTVNTQQRSAKRTKDRESALTIAEGVLETQAFALSSGWSQASDKPFAQCLSSASTQTTYCPDKTSLSSTFPSSDYSGATWTSDVFDNSSTEGGNAMQSFYSDSLATKAPRYDANGDNQVWVRASATYMGKTRRLVALVKRQQNPAENFPFNTITAANLTNSNNGNKVIEQLTSASGAVGPVRLRCTASTTCPSIDRTNQVSPSGQVYTGYAGGNALDAAALGRLKSTARANGTLYTSCPASLTGAVVWLDISAGTTCKYTANNDYNTQSSPGMLIVADGKIQFRGTGTFYGVIYAVNASNSSAPDVVDIGGNWNVVGAIAVDGNGGITNGSSKQNIQFDDNVVKNVHSYGTTGVVQNTWRELGGQ